MVAVGGGAQYFKVKERMRRDVGAFKSMTRRFMLISDVIQGDNVVREDVLDLIMSGAWRSSSERWVMKYESRRSVRVTGGIVMRGVEFRSHVNLW